MKTKQLIPEQSSKQEEIKQDILKLLEMNKNMCTAY